MSAPTVNPAALRAITAYANPASRPDLPVETEVAAFKPAGRQIVRTAPGVSVELSADARAALIAVQSDATIPPSTPPVLQNAATADGPQSLPGKRLNLSI